MRAGMQRSLNRMDEITAYYASQCGVLAVAAFGSNAEQSRFDDSSDLDFLVFAESGAKACLIAQVDRLAQLGEIDALRIVYGDAVQLLFSDGVLCDFGIILPDQLATFPHGAGRYLWQRSDWQAVDLSASEPARKPTQELEEDALFHLYLGLLRIERGEEATAFEEIQIKAAQCVLALLQGDRADAFSPLRRAEQTVSPEALRRLMPGYEHSREAAAYLLEQLQALRHTPLFRAVSALVRGQKE
jgi:predicted nucleotidyltransferase